MSESAFYFVGRYAEVGHDEKAAGIEQGRTYPVFITYNRKQPEQKHTHAWFVCEEDAIEHAKLKNAHNNKGE